MHLFIKLTILSILVMPGTIFGCLNCKSEELKCKKVFVSADLNWPPYAIQHGEDIRGVGVDLIKKIFAELDIPVGFVPLLNKRKSDNALRHGDIDIVLSTYDYPEIENDVDLIQPGYLRDPIAVLLRETQAQSLKRWEDLIGQRGLSTVYFQFDKEFFKFKKNYLYIQENGTGEDLIHDMDKRKADYAIGSRLQLDYLLKSNAPNRTMLLPNEITLDADVHMAFSKQSECKVYAPYVRKRLIELKNDGTIMAILDDYISIESLKNSAKESISFTHSGKGEALSPKNQDFGIGGKFSYKSNVQQNN